MKALQDWITADKVDGLALGMVLFAMLFSLVSCVLCACILLDLQEVNQMVYEADQASARRHDRLEGVLAKQQLEQQAFIMQHSAPIQLGTLNAEEVAKLNVQLAMAIAANTGCTVNLVCDLEQ